MSFSLDDYVRFLAGHSNPELLEALKDPDSEASAFLSGLRRAAAASMPGLRGEESLTEHSKFADAPRRAAASLDQVEFEVTWPALITPVTVGAELLASATARDNWNLLSVMRDSSKAPAVGEGLDCAYFESALSSRQPVMLTDGRHIWAFRLSGEVLQVVVTALRGNRVSELGLQFEQGADLLLDRTSKTGSVQLSLSDLATVSQGTVLVRWKVTDN